MKRALLFCCLWLTLATSYGALTFVKRETFVGPGTLTATSPGSNFSSVTGVLNLVRVGPRTSAVAAPGWSADVRSTTASNFCGTINLAGATTSSGLWGTWVRVKTLPQVGNYLTILQLYNRGSTNLVAEIRISPDGSLTTTPYNYGGSAVTYTGPKIALNTWVWVAFAWQTQSGGSFPYGLRCMSQPLGGALNIWASVDGLNALDTSFSSVTAGVQFGGVGPLARIGCPSLYAISSFADLAYPSDILPPVEQSNAWYVNAATGNDANDGATATTAWKTAAKVTTESQYCGLLDSNAAGPGNGDSLTIDTSNTPLIIGANPLVFSTLGLKVQPVAGQTYIRCQAEDMLSNASFTATSGLSKTYQTNDTQTNIVAWENDKWMWHVKAASFTAAASITDPTNNTTTNYASAGAALDAVPGSFYTDGTQLYLHPFGDTRPSTDGKIYTRSYNRNQMAAVTFTAGNYRAIGFYIRKTTLVDSGDNDFAAYCFQDVVLSGSGQSSTVEGGYFAYGDKHCFGSTGGLTNSSLLILNTECEQGHPYCGFGGQTPFVSYSGVTTADNLHTYRGCICLARSGRIGSTAGDTVGTGGDIILSHNNGTGTTFATITLDHCNFASGSANLGVAKTLIITNQSQMGQVMTNCSTTKIDQTTFPYEGVSMLPLATQLSLQSCLFKPVFALKPNPPFYGILGAGNISIQACTFDLSGVTGDSTHYFLQGFIQRQGVLNLTFRNNVYVVPSGEDLPLVYGATTTDTLTFDHNAYNLGSGTTLVRAFSSANANLNFAQWQASGHDCTNSTLNANLLLQNDVPQSGSPLFNAGIDLGSAPDVTGATYAHRNTLGAYQGSSTYRAPQSITGFPPLLGPSPGATINLPATTAAGLTITYTIVAGTGQLSGHTLTLNGENGVTLSATSSGNATYASITSLETITPLSIQATDTPTLPQWGLIALTLGLFVYATSQLAPLKQRHNL